MQLRQPRQNRVSLRRRPSRRIPQLSAQHKKRLPMHDQLRSPILDPHRRQILRQRRPSGHSQPKRQENMQASLQTTSVIAAEA